VKIEITTDVQNHQINEDYPCLLVYLDPEEDALNYSIDENKLISADWMPQFSELEKIIEEMCKLDPEFERRVKEILRDQEREIPAVKEGDGVDLKHSKKSV